MYKYVKEFTQPLANFSYEGLKQKKKDQELDKLLDERKTKDQKLKEKAFLKDTGDFIETVTCTLCDKEIRNDRRSVMNHENSKGHQKRLEPVKGEYKKIKKFFKRFVLHGKRPMGRGYRRLKYYRMIMTYRQIEDLENNFN